VDGDGELEVISGGWFWDGSQLNSQLCVWDGASLAVEDIHTWCWTPGSWINSVAVGSVDGDVRDEIVTGGCYNDGARNVAQLCVWKYS
jgi:hypothetical protein